MIISIDPGVHASGVAIWSDEAELLHACYTDSIYLPELIGKYRKTVAVMFGTGHPIEVARVLVELPQVYDRRHSKGDPQDLVNLAFSAGRCVGILAGQGAFTLSPVLPREWKGQVKKEIMLKRILGRLTPSEKANIKDAGAQTHNIIDAIGIGLHYFKRLQPKRG